MLFKKEQQKMKCGFEYNYSDSSRTKQMLHILYDHSEEIITKGNKRKKKIICEPTGKWWYKEMPNLKQVK